MRGLTLTVLEQKMHPPRTAKASNLGEAEARDGQAGLGHLPWRGGGRGVFVEGVFKGI